MKLKINTMKKIFGLSTNGVKLYEKAGIIKPYRQLDNGYREYDVSELQLMGFATQMRSYGYSMQELEDFIHSLTIEEQLESYRKREQQIEDEIRMLNASRKSLLAEISHTETAMEIMDKCSVGMSEPTYFFGMRRGEEFIRDESAALSGDWIKRYAPHVSSAVLLDGPYFLDESYSRVPIYGVSADARIAMDIGLMLSKDTVFMPPKMSVIRGVTFDYRKPDFTEVRARVRKFAEEKGYRLVGGGFIRLNQTMQASDSLKVNGILYAPLKADDSEFGIML